MSRRHPHGRAYPGAGNAEFLAQLALRLKPGTVTMLEYRHDDDCPALRRGPCACDPDVAIIPMDDPEAKA